jgi:PAS domain S-box-containing protein
MKLLPLVFNNGAHPFFALRAPPVASRAVVGVLAVSAMVAATLLSTGRSAYPDLHNILDTGACLLSGVLALLLWDISARLGQPFLRWVAIAFAGTSLLEVFHTIVVVEWHGRLDVMVRAQDVLRPATWGPSAFMLPIGLAFSLGMLRKGRRLSQLYFASGLAVLSFGLIVIFYRMPRYTPPTWFDLTRPNLLLVPVLWLTVGFMCYRLRVADRVLPIFTMMAAVLFLAHVSMLYSRAPHDTLAMVAHLGKVAGYLVVLLSVMQMASLDTLELVRAEVRFRRLLESAPDAMVVANQRGAIVLVNARFEKLFGYKREDASGQPIELILPERFRSKYASAVSELVADLVLRPMGVTLELSGLHADGSEFPVEITLSPSETEDGFLVSTAIRDITERRQSENRIKELNRNLEERAQELTVANKELEAFTYTAAHDLRAPLRHLHGFAVLLSQGWHDRMDEDGRHFLGKILSSSKRMGVLLDDLLNFSRLGRVSLQRRRVNLAQLVERVRQELPAVEGGSLVWEIGELPEVEGDEALLQQVVVNLLSNAVKYSRKTPDARIVVGSRNDAESTVTVFVRDNGSGFEMQYVDKLFQVFQRLHRAEDFEGTGIGLAIVRRVIERHGGRVWAEAVLGQGATFYFSLPKGKQTNEAARVRSAGR